MPRLLPPLVVLTALAAGACQVGTSSWNGPAVRGSGVVAEQPRSIEAFDAVELSGSFRMTLEQGAPRELVVVGDDNLLARVETRVEDGVLHVRTLEPVTSRAGLSLRIRTPELRRVGLAGSHEVELRSLSGEVFTLEGSGSHEVRAQGEVERLELSLAGSSELDLRALGAREARVDASGSHELVLDARERLELELSGSSSVRYLGEPSVQVSASGSSSVRRL